MGHRPYGGRPGPLYKLPLISFMPEMDDAEEIHFFLKCRVTSQDCTVFLIKCLSNVAIFKGAGHHHSRGSSQAEVQGRNFLLLHGAVSPSERSKPLSTSREMPNDGNGTAALF